MQQGSRPSVFTVVENLGNTSTIYVHYLKHIYAKIIWWGILFTSVLLRPTQLCKTNILGPLLTSVLLALRQLRQANNSGTFAYFCFIKFNTAMPS